MKYTIEGFSQEYALTFKKTVPKKGGGSKVIKLDFTDLVILRWFVDFYPNMKKMEVNGKLYAMLVHSKLLSDLPLLDISKKAVIDRMKKLVEFEILDYEIVRDGGTFSLYTFGNKYAGLVGSLRESDQFEHTPYPVNHTQGGGSTIQGVGGQPYEGVYGQPYEGAVGQPYNKDNNTNYSSTNHSSIKDNGARHKYGEYSHVLLSDVERDSLFKIYGEELATEYITFLDEYIEMKGYKAKNHYLAIKKWVVDAVKERKQKKGHSEQEWRDSWANA